MSIMITIRSRYLRLILALSVLASAGCSALPNVGPAASAIRDEAASTKAFKLVDISAAELASINAKPEPGLTEVFGNDTAETPLILGPGDGISIGIWESGSEPLFAGMQGGAASALAASGLQSTSARSTGLPEAIIGTDGAISLPFAGRIKLAGLNTIEAQAAIEKALSGLTQKPQVTVILTRNLNSTVTLFGEGTAVARVPLTAYGERLLDVLASSGGARGPASDLQVQLTRGDRSASTSLNRLLSVPSENIRLMPHDQIVVSSRPRTFTSFGATGRNTQIGFDTPKLSLIEAIAKSGGILDTRADPKGVFLLRYESAADAQGKSEPVPVVYCLDLSSMGSYFLAQNFEMRSKDILYVSNSPATQFEKFLTLVGLATQPIVTGAVISTTTRN